MSETAQYAIDVGNMRTLLKWWHAGTTPLPGYEGNNVGPDITARGTETHECRVCGARARMHFVAETTVGPRWLDLCHPHASLVAAANSPDRWQVVDG